MKEKSEKIIEGKTVKETFINTKTMGSTGTDHDLEVSSTEPVISKDEYFRNARQMFLRECCLTADELVPYQQMAEQIGMLCIHLRTRGNDDIIGSYPGYNTLYKHIFLQNSNFKTEVVNHYRNLGYAWVDIVPLNRRDWKIFLWPRNQYHST